jgi:hypothetical protein
MGYVLGGLGSLYREAQSLAYKYVLSSYLAFLAWYQPGT